MRLNTIRAFHTRSLARERCLETIYRDRVDISMRERERESEKMGTREGKQEKGRAREGERHTYPRVYAGGCAHRYM